MRLIWFCVHPTPYHIYFLQHLAAEQEIDMFAYFTCRYRPSHPWKQQRNQSFPHDFCDTLLGKVRAAYDALTGTKKAIVLPGWNEPLSWLLVLGSVVRKRPFVIWSDTPNVEKHRTGLRRVLHKYALPWVFRRARVVMGTGHPGGLALTQMGCPPDKIVNLPFSVDLDSFSPLTSPRNAQSKIVIVSSGRLDFGHKGYDVALAALAKLKNVHPSIAFEYRIAGVGPDREALLRRAGEMGVGNNIVLLNWVEASELPSLYRSADIFLHPSRFDPFPNAVLEAMACGLPVIGSDAAGSVVDRVVDGVNGYIFRSGDAEHLADRLIRAFSERHNWTEMGRAARQTAEEWPVSRSVSTIRMVLESC
jgi:glycosyltransferase involved in cell wall biosynthesis